VTIRADDDMVMHGNAERGRDVDDCLRHQDVGLRRRGIAARVVAARPARTCIGVTDLVRDALIEIDCIAKR